jgi:signal transduction histidine kinase
VARHANASTVEVTLAEHPDHLELRVQDDGRGISTRELNNTRSLGLVGMRERIHLLGGELEIGRGPQGGTRVLIKLPRRAS